ncbi:MAG: protein kinase [Gemmatimonadota bacterium]
MSGEPRDRLNASFAGRYVVGEVIERGGMAVVYAAEDLEHGRTVAIKVLSATLAATPGAERFLREIDVVARLQHTNILTLIDSGEVDGLPYYVMPFVEGQSLADRLERGDAIPVDEAVRIACEVADALQVAHDRGIVHRDIKPGNILISEGHAVVADFGIASAQGDSEVARLTETGVSLGSPVYMSPEQASGERSIDHRTDLYSLGCVLYEMLAGRPPFEGSMRTLLAQKVLGQVRPLRDVRDDVPRGVESAVARAMRIEPGDRFLSAADLRQALLASLPTKTGRGGSVRRRGLAAAAVVVVVFGAAALQRARASEARAMAVAERLAEIEGLIEGGRYTDALELANEVEAISPGDTTLARLLPEFSFAIEVRTDPPGARIYLQSMDGPEDAWQDLGTAPVEGVRFAGVTIDAGPLGQGKAADRPWRLRFALQGYQERELLLTAFLGTLPSAIPPIDPVTLTPIDAALEGMVPIPGFTLNGVEHGDYYMDRYEVTNAEYKHAVDAGGYTDPRYWNHPVVLEGRELGFAEIMALLRDQTGRPGPSTWRLGTFPDGQAEYPVGGVSWHEAAAFAQWAGKQLPTAARSEPSA